MNYGLIYCVTNSINGKVYIGQTVTGLTKRMIGHCSNARKHTFEIPFHRAIRKYGESVFSWDILDTASTKDELNEKEKHWILFYDSTNRQKGYNATVGGDAFGGKGEDNFWHGKKRTEENKAKISETLKQTRKEKGNPRDRAVMQLSVDGELIAEFKSGVETGFDRKAVNACCNGRQVSCGGYLWIHKENYNDEFVNLLVDRYKNRSGGADKSVIALDLNNKFVKEYTSIEQAVKHIGGNGSSITACCRGRQKTAYGYIWIYKKDYNDL